MYRLACLLSLSAVLAVAGCANQRSYELHEGPGEGAVLTVPYYMDVVRLDDQDLGDSPFTWDARTQRLELDPGRHQLVLRYHDIWREDDDSVTVRSAPLQLTFRAQAGRAYRVAAPAPEGLAQARAFAEAPTAAVEAEATGETVSSRPAAATGTQAGDGGRQAVAAGDPRSLAMLKYWWRQAGEQERRAFRAYITAP